MSAASEQRLLEVRDLNVELATDGESAFPVRDISFSLDRGEALGIVGESGSGKSMTALALLRLLPGNAARVSGNVTLGGEDITAMSDRRFAAEIAGKRIAMIFQDPMSSLNPVYTIGRQLMEKMVRPLEGGGGGAARERALYLLDRVGIPDPATRLRQYPHQLSGGLRQRAMIAMALMNSPDLVIADEPTTALDVTIQARILDLLAELQAEFGMAMILITHDIAILSRNVRRIGVMYAGELVEIGDTARILRDPLHPYTQGLLRCVPDAAGNHGGRLGSIPGIVPSRIGALDHCGFVDRCVHAQPVCSARRPELRPSGDGRAFRCVIPEPALRVAREATQGAVAIQTAGTGQTTAVAEQGPVFAVENLACRFRMTKGLFKPAKTIVAVDDVSLKVREGEVLAIVGESGSGKTTLSRMLLGLQRPTSGSVLFRGKTLEELSVRERARMLQAVFQDPNSSLNPAWSIGRTIRRPLDIHDVGKAGDRRAAVEEMLALVGLSPDLYHVYPSQLSGGQRQRVAIARAIVMRPDVLICDEPTSALDVSVQGQILNLLLDLRQQLSLTYVIISHDLGVVRYMASRVAVMSLGKIVELGDVEQIFERPAHPYTQSLLAAAPSLDSGPSKRIPAAAAAPRLVPSFH